MRPEISPKSSRAIFVSVIRLGKKKVNSPDRTLANEVTSHDAQRKQPRFVMIMNERNKIPGAGILLPASPHTLEQNYFSSYDHLQLVA